MTAQSNRTYEPLRIDSAPFPYHAYSSRQVRLYALAEYLDPSVHRPERVHLELRKKGIAEVLNRRLTLSDCVLHGTSRAH